MEMDKEIVQTIKDFSNFNYLQGKNGLPNMSWEDYLKEYEPSLYLMQGKNGQRLKDSIEQKAKEQPTPTQETEKKLNPTGEIVNPYVGAEVPKVRLKVNPNSFEPQETGKEPCFYLVPVPKPLTFAYLVEVFINQP